MPPAADRPLRIRVVHTRFLHWGGRSGYVRLIDYLDRERFRVALSSASDSHDDLPRWLSPFRLQLRRGVRRRMPWYKLSDLKAEVEAFASCVAGQCDVIHFLDGEHAPQYLPLWLKRTPWRPVRVIATFHQPPGILKDLIDFDVVRSLDHVLLVSPSQRSFFERFLPRDRVHVILHGVDTDFFHAPAARRSSGGFSCITVGNWLRDWQILGQIARRMPDVRFHVVTSRTTGLDGLSNICFHKDIEDAALAEMYRQVDVLLLPLLDSTANNALLEGIASGLPTVCTDLSSTRAYLNHSGAIFVEPGSADGFVAALTRLRDAPEDRPRLGASVRARAEDLAWPVLIREYEALYRAVVGR